MCTTHEYIMSRTLGINMPGVEQVVGVACLELLEQGWKVELEGASNPVSHRPGFLRLLRDHLLARSRRLP